MTSPQLHVNVLDRQTAIPMDVHQVEAFVRHLLANEGIQHGEVNIVLAGDDEICDVNRRFLQRDYATDVISFCHDLRGTLLDGDVIVNAQLANRRAPEIGWSAVEELTLYVVHGLLHLLGYDDMDAQSLTKMRHREALHLRQILGHVCPDRHAGLQVASASKEETT